MIIGTTISSPGQLPAVSVSSGNLPAKARPWASATMLNEDYKETLQCLAGEKVKFLLVGPK